MQTVHSLGHGCVSDAMSLQRAAARIPDGRAVVVTSAVAGVTETLLDIMRAGSADTDHRVDAVLRRHVALAETVGLDASEIQPLCSSLRAIVSAAALTGAVDARLTDQVLATAEKLAARLIAGALRGRGRIVTVHDADGFLSTDDHFGAASVLSPVAARTVSAALAADEAAGRVSVVTGFIGRAPDGATTTFGPSGGDISAMVVAAAIGAHEVVLWTDTDGLLSADPAVVDDPEPIQHLHYREAAELSFHGTRLLHPRAMIPAQAAHLSVRVKNVADPDAPGTVVDGQFSRGERPVKAVCAVREQALLSIEGKGMAGVAGLSGRVFQALAGASVSATMISQTGSEASICLAVDRRFAEASAYAIRAALRAELSRGEIEDVAVRRQAGLVAIIGLGMASTPGIAARAMTALAERGINIQSIAQGVSELNITVAVDERRVDDAIRTLHAAFGFASASGVPLGRVRAANGTTPFATPTGAAVLPRASAAAAVDPQVSFERSPHPAASDDVGQTVTAFAPATVANLGLGFDILGLSLGDVGDRVVAWVTETPGVHIVDVTGDGGRLPRDPAKNSAGVAAAATMKAAGIEVGVALEVHKGLPLGSGMGSSAASAAAAAVAVNALLGNPLRPVELIPPCVEAEAVVSAAHADNVAPSLLGGLVLIRSLDPLDVIRLPLPESLTVAVVTPDIEVNTRASREVLPSAVSLPSLVRWTANIAALTCACFTSDLDLMARCITEDEVTAARAGLIPGCRDVIRAAMQAGCLGSSISGSGPSVFALCRSPADGRRVAEAMVSVFAQHGLQCRQVVSRAECPGARVV